MKWTFGVLCLLAAATASGQSIYKCRDAKGGLVYQSDPCVNAEKRWDIQPGAEYGSRSPEDQMSAAAAERSIDATRYDVRVANSRRAVSTSIGGGDESVVSGPSKPISGANRGFVCQATRNAADAARKQSGHRLTFNAASGLDQSVRNACK